MTPSATLKANHSGRVVNVLVDADVAERYAANGLSIGSHGYPQISGVVPNRSVLLHRVLLDAKPGEYVDHINGDRLDNRRANLRLCTNRQNGQNQAGRPTQRKSSYKGVYKHAQHQPPFQAYLQIDGRRRSAGYYTSEEGAARAYDMAALHHFGPFARTNFPREDYLFLSS